MNSSDFSKELWKISNAIVAFVVIQTISFSIMCTNDDFRSVLASASVGHVISLLQISVMVSYGA